MLDINAMSERYGLTTEQATSLEASYRSLPQSQRDSFGIRDFETLMANQGITALAPPDGDLPALPPARLTEFRSSDFVAIASLGAAVMQLLTQNASEQRQINKVIRAAESEAVAKMIESQAKDIKDKAITQLVLGLVAGTITIAGGAFTAYKAGVAMDAGKVTKNVALQTNTKLSSQSQAFQGASSIFSTLSAFAGGMFDSKIKEKDAMIERARSNVEQLKEINESLMDLIRKSLSTAEAIEESANQARMKILA